MSHRGESMEEDDMVMRVGNSLSTGERERRTDGGGRAASPRDLIRRCQKIPYSIKKKPCFAIFICSYSSCGCSRYVLNFYKILNLYSNCCFFLPAYLELRFIIS